MARVHCSVEVVKQVKQFEPIRVTGGFDIDVSSAEDVILKGAFNELKDQLVPLVYEAAVEAVEAIRKAEA